MNLILLFVTTWSAALGPSAPPTTYRTTPPMAWWQGDPADSLYRAARRLLDDKDYSSAAKAFDALVTRYPRSVYAPDALYWKGFALYRNGDLAGAQEALAAQTSRYPVAATHSDAASLLIVLKGELAQRGDAQARRDVDSAATTTTRGCQDMEVQQAALDAVQQMDPDRSVPLLQKVLARRDACSVPLRKNALFIIAQRGGENREKILLESARNDPDLGVRKDAVFHLSTVHSPLAVDALQDMLLHNTDAGVRSDALFALAQMKTDRSKGIVREFALSASAPVNLRKDAFFDLSQNASDDDVAWLRQAYPKVDDVSVRSDLLFQISSRPSSETSKWLGTVANDLKEDMNVRKNTLFYLSQRKDDDALNALIDVAKHGSSTDIRKEALFHLGQSKDPRALKAIEEIAVP